VVSLVLLAGVLGMPNTTRPAAAQVDWCEKLQQSNDAFNRGEIDLMLEDFADDMVFVAAPVCVAVECVGKDAYRNLMQHFVERKAQSTVTSCEVSGNTVAMTLDWACDPTRAAGVDRIVVRPTYEIEGEQVVAQRGFNDLTDPQTAQFQQYWLARPNATFEMGPGRDADQSPGIADMREFPDLIALAVRIAPSPAGVPQPMHIHEGTCANLGPVALSLRDVDRGLSWTTLRGVSLTDLQTGNFAIAVQKSHDEPDVYVACGDIPAAAAAAPPVAPAPATGEAPPVAPAPAAELPSAGSGGLLGEEGISLPTWWYALAAGGTLLIMGGLAGQWRARRRR